MPNPPRHNRCACGKVISRSLPAARLLHAKVWASKGGDPSAYFYECRYGHFHWTSDTEQTNHKKVA